MSRLIRHISRRAGITPLESVTPDAQPVVPATSAPTGRPSRTFVYAGLGIGALVIVLALLILPNLNRSNNQATDAPSTQAAQNPTADQSPVPTPVPPTSTSTLSLTEQEATIQALMLDEIEASTATAAHFQTATATQWTPVPTPDLRATAVARITFEAQTAVAQAALDQTATATLWTPTPSPTLTPSFTPTPTPTPTRTPVPPGYPGGPPITANNQWSTVIQAFDGVDMALVPVGCFMMGSEDGSSDEQPVQRQCIDQPFWIDKTEVTNAQYGSEGYFKGGNRPRESINWSDARDFCVSRGARLPTELEWEYAARGPDNLTYPWGNTFVADNVVYEANADETADVGSRPDGVSWVGALDMSGNVWEWVRTIYDTDQQTNAFPYPYRADDGREDLERTDVLRVLRGGSWGNHDSFVRAPYRGWYNPDFRNDYVGLRCARSY